MTQSYPLKEVEGLARRLAKKILFSKNRERAVVLALEGELGSGKTTFTQFFAKALGIKEVVLSPTFVILKRFKINDLRFKNLIHIDAYRIENPKEILELGWKQLVEDPCNIIVVEWAEKIKKILPKDAISIKLKHAGENERKIIVSK